MKENCKCPFCNTDITDFMHEMVVRYNRRKTIESVNTGIDAEKRERMNKASLERLKKWREENPGRMYGIAKKASHSRTKASFRKQAETLRETIRKKTVKFAELLYQAKTKGEEITPELEKTLMEKAAESVREGRRQEKKKK